MKYVNQPVLNAAQKMRLKMTKKIQYWLEIRLNPKEGYIKVHFAM